MPATDAAAVFEAEWDRARAERRRTFSRYLIILAAILSAIREAAAVIYL